MKRLTTSTVMMHQTLPQHALRDGAKSTNLSKFFQLLLEIERIVFEVNRESQSTVSLSSSKTDLLPLTEIPTNFGDQNKIIDSQISTNTLANQQIRGALKIIAKILRNRNPKAVILDDELNARTVEISLALQGLEAAFFQKYGEFKLTTLKRRAISFRAFCYSTRNFGSTTSTTEPRAVRYIDTGAPRLNRSLTIV